jgi:hypothetical protein
VRAADAGVWWFPELLSGILPAESCSQFYGWSLSKGSNMSPGEFIAKRKAHLIFGGAFLFALAFNIMSALMAGESFPAATWRGISEIRPMDYVMLALFWYACAFHRPKDEWESSLTALNLSGSNSQK